MTRMALLGCLQLIAPYRNDIHPCCSTALLTMHRLNGLGRRHRHSKTRHPLQAHHYPRHAALLPHTAVDRSRICFTDCTCWDTYRGKVQCKRVVRAARVIQAQEGAVQKQGESVRGSGQLGEGDRGIHRSGIREKLGKRRGLLGSGQKKPANLVGKGVRYSHAHRAAQRLPTGSLRLFYVLPLRGAGT